MRTTLKRGLGRAAHEGNGRPVLPPGALSPINVYEQPPRRRRWLRQALLWSGIAVLVLISGTAGGAYLYYHQHVEQLGNLTPAEKRTQKNLAVVSADQPAVALVIGYDHRSSDGKGAPSRSDTLMLVQIG